MAAPTKDQIQASALAALSSYPTVAQFVQAGDPRVLAQIGAQAAMLAMLAEHVDVAQFEPFLKARDSTVLADASLKGILPLARACRLTLLAKNQGDAAYVLPAGRRLMDPKGRIYEVESAVTVPAYGEASVLCVQRSRRTQVHAVTAPTPFYAVQIDPGSGGDQLEALQVTRQPGAAFTYAPEWFNVRPGDLAYQVETDERRRLWVLFGKTNVVGYQVQVGDVFEVQVTECRGRIQDLAVGATFSFEYILTAEDGAVEMALQSVTDQGADQLSVQDLRLMSRYPAIYDHNAVYLGEFDLLLRRYISPVTFLSVWNEQIEEASRGPNILNMNTLFVAGIVPSMTLAAFEARVSELIARADDSYRIRFVEAVPTPVSVTVRATVSVVHDTATVEAQVRAAILGKYGAGAIEVSKGLANPVRYQAISKLLRETVPALQDDQSDFRVEVVQPVDLLPEMFLHVTPASLVVQVERAQFNNGLWNY